jgi:enoyl-CoA hydratase/carnithine racemase
MSNPKTVSNVLVEHAGPVTHLRLNRPEKLNALDASIVEQVISGVAEAENRGSRLLVISGEGRAFSAGFDLSELDRSTDGDLLLRFVRIEILLRAILAAPMTTLAFVHGRCFGAAADLFCACDHRFAASDATFRFPGLRFGAVLGTRRLARLIGPDDARDVLESSGVIDATRATRLGMVQCTISREQLADVITRQAEAASILGPVAQKNMLDNIRIRCRDSDLAELVQSLASPGLVERMRDFSRDGQSR